MRGVGAFEKIKCIFSIAPVGILEKLRGETLTGRWCWQHRTLVQSIRCGVCGSGVQSAPDAGRLLFERPVVRDVSECMRGVSD